MCTLVALFSHNVVAGNDFGEHRSNDDDKILSLFDISFDELLDITIATSGKRQERIGEIPASIVLITRDEIKKYGILVMKMTEV